MTDDLKIITERDRFVVKASLFFLFITHIYRWTNAAFNQDSLLILQNDSEWQMGLGRILNPVYVWIRGLIGAPMVCAVFGSIFLIAAVVMIVRMLDLKRKSTILLTCGIISVNEALTLLNASFVNYYDAYMLSFLLYTAAVYFVLFSPNRYHWALASGCLILGLCVFQGYIEAFLFLLEMILLRRTLQGEDPKKIWHTGLKTILLLAVSAVIYLLLVKAVLSAYGLTLYNGYNGLTQMQDLSRFNLLNILKTWAYCFWYLLHVEYSHPVLSAFMHVILAVTGIYLIVKICRRIQPDGRRLTLIIFLLTIMPFSVNAVYLLTNRSKSTYMKFPYVLLYVFVLMLTEMGDEAEISERIRKEIRKTVPAVFTVLIFCHFIYANQYYLKKELEYTSGVSLMTRIVDRMETTEGYTVGVTPVAILGYMPDSPLSMDRRGLDHMHYDTVGRLHHMPMTYYDSYFNYFEYILGYPINLLQEGELPAVAAKPEVIQMPVFPYEGSVKMVDGVLVVKLSEDMRTERQRGYK